MKSGSEMRHFTEYLIIATISMVFVCLLNYLRYDKGAMIFLSIMISVFYLLWGILHFALEGRLTKLVIYEYILFSALVFLLLYTALSF